MDRRSKYTTWFVFVALFAAMVVLYFFGAGNYLPAWLLSIVLAVAALCALSIPRFVRVSEQSVEIHCTVEITQLYFDDIRSVRVLSERECSKMIPLLASHGFFGYFGFYLDVENWDIVRIYACSMRELVEIEDVFENRYIVGIPNAPVLCSAVSRALDNSRNVGPK